MNRRDTGVRFSKAMSVFICLIAYLAGLAFATAVVIILDRVHPLPAAFAADFAATVVVFVFSGALNNSSMYDPYWSVAPLPLALYWLYRSAPAEITARQVAVLVLILAWGGRLTYNWYRQWKGLGHEDWRYMDFRTKTGKFYWPVSFLGIHFFPTVMVFTGCLSVYAVMSSPGAPLGMLDAAGLAVAAGAIVVEAVADRQLHAFVKSNPPREAILSTGLWACSRHPNYFGEISFWWGLFLFSVAAGAANWWTVAGPVAMTIMFVAVSIPLMEKRMLSRRPQYAERQKRVSALVPWFPGKKG